MSTIIAANTAFIEQDCVFEHEGHKFESGGSYLLKRKDNGKLQGILYRHNDDEIGTWDSSKKVRAYFGRPFRTNFNTKAQYCWFTWEGHKMIGRNNSIEWQDIFRVKEINS